MKRSDLSAQESTFQSFKYSLPKYVTRKDGPCTEESLWMLFFNRTVSTRWTAKADLFTVSAYRGLPSDFDRDFVPACLAWKSVKLLQLNTSSQRFSPPDQISKSYCLECATLMFPMQMDSRLYEIFNFWKNSFCVCPQILKFLKTAVGMDLHYQFDFIEFVQSANRRTFLLQLPTSSRKHDVTQRNIY
jgi:hypothetical protein